MLPLLLLSNLRLVVYLFGGLVFAAMSWLYFDALFVRPQRSVALRAIGAMLLSISYLAGAVMVEGTGLAWVATLGQIVHWIRIAGYIVLAFGVWGEPLSERPRVLAVTGSIATWALPILPAFVGLGYLRRASVGLERHLLGMAYGMYILTFAEILDLRRLFVQTVDIRVYEYTRDFGAIWIGQVLLLLIGLIMISRWVFSYLLRRFETQITLFMGMLVMSVFAMATLSFTYVMVNRLELGAKSVVVSGGKMIQANWIRSGDELLELSRKYASDIETPQEELTKKIEGEVNKVVVVNKEGRDVITGELWGEYPAFKVAQNKGEALGYQIIGVGSGQKLVLMAVKKDSLGGAISIKEMGGEMLEQSSKETEMAVRIVGNQVVLASSSVPNHPELASVVGLTRNKAGKLGGVEYVEAEVGLVNAEGVNVATLVTATPASNLWAEVSWAIMITYLVGVAILILMEVPAIMMSRYLTRQLK